MSPSTVQMYSGESVTVVIENPKTFERYFLDYQTGQASLKPDVASSVIQGLLPALGKLQSLSVEGYTPSGKAAAPVGPCQIPKIKTLPPLNEVAKDLPAFQGCVGYLANTAIEIYQELEQFVAPDSRTPFAVDESETVADVQTHIGNFLWNELTLSNSIAAISKAYPTPTAGDPNSEAIAQLGSLQKVADQIAVDLTGYNQRITDLDTVENGTWIDRAPPRLARNVERGVSDDHSRLRRLVN